MTNARKRPDATLDRERAQLQEWLNEWNVEQHLADADELEATPHEIESADTETISGPVAQSELKTGAVLLLHSPKGFNGWMESPLYALLICVEKSTALLVPFGRYSVPAIPEEWRTPLSYGPLRVLCFWNERSVAISRFPGCWLTKTLSEKQLHACMSARMRVMIGSIQAADGAGRYGPRLLHPGDPRHQYLSEERARIDVHLGDPLNSLRLVEEESAPYLMDGEGQSHSFLLAAETMTGYGIRGGTYMSEDTEVVVATYVEDPNRIRIRIVDREGRRVQRYEGGYVEGITGLRSDRIQQGVALAHPDLADTLALITAPSGPSVRLIATFS